MPQAVFLEGIGQELTYILPYAGAKDGTFALLFKELDLEMGELGITSYGISDTTLEEVENTHTHTHTHTNIHNIRRSATNSDYATINHHLLEDNQW